MKISIITPTLNSEEYIEQAIQSVLAQEYTNFEHIVVDGGSTDETINILKKYPHIKWISEPDKGQSDAMNKGFKMSQGEVIVYLNCDDYFLDGAFHAVIPHLKSGYKFVVGDVILKLDDGREFTIQPNVDYKKMLKHWEYAAFPNNPVQYFYAREVQESFPFNINNKKTMDLEFLFNAANKYEFKHIDKVLGVYLLLDGAVSVEAQKDPMYWTFETFDFIDKHLLKFEKEEILEFKKEQQLAYLERAYNAINQDNKNKVYDDLISSIKNLVSVKFSMHPFKKYQYYKEVLKYFYRTGQ